MAGCDYVLPVASPLGGGAVADRNARAAPAGDDMFAAKELTAKSLKVVQLEAGPELGETDFAPASAPRHSSSSASPYRSGFQADLVLRVTMREARPVPCTAVQYFCG